MLSLPSSIQRYIFLQLCFSFIYFIMQSLRFHYFYQYFKHFYDGKLHAYILFVYCYFYPILMQRRITPGSVSKITPDEYYVSIIHLLLVPISLPLVSNQKVAHQMQDCQLHPVSILFKTQVLVWLTSNYQLIQSPY